MHEHEHVADKIKDLVYNLNIYRHYYYNKNTMLISDKEYDELFDKLVKLEEESGIIYSNSPTQTVGYEVQSSLNKVTHDHPMLSLGKTKDVLDIIKFSDCHDIVAMLKMDGLTCSLSYNKEGYLEKAETRGNGEVGEDVLKNARFIKNIPLKINNNGIPFTIDGEVIIDYNDFEEVNKTLSEGDKYSHPRNLASGSIRQLDTEVTANRQLKFIAWRVIRGSKNQNSFFNNLQLASNLGFDTVPHLFVPIHPKKSESSLKNAIESEIAILKKAATKLNYPIDGIVFTYDDIEYGNSKGMTGHHPLHSIAYKFYDDEYETTLRDVEWSVSRTGQINPVAIFDPVDLDGAVTTRATLHNVSIIKELKLGLGDRITVYRANQVIPKVGKNLTYSNDYVFPTICPCCGAPTEIRRDGIAEVMYCTNDDCPATKVSSFAHFVSKAGMDINGLGNETLEKMIGIGVIQCYADLYHLKEHKKELLEIEGFGQKSFDKLIDSIEKSRTVTLDKFLVALGIRLIGKTAAKAISKYFEGDYDKFWNAFSNHFDFTQLDNFGDEMANSLNDWYQESVTAYGFNLWDDLEKELTFIKPEKVSYADNFITGKVFCVTGAFNTMKRSDIEKIITERGGKLAGSVSKKTSFLLTNEAESGSSKAKKAKELAIPVMSEIDFLKQIGM